MVNTNSCAVEVAKDCDATVDPLSDVIVPPAPPASVPQKNAPPVHMSFSVDALQDESDAPKRAARVSPPVEDALPKYVCPLTVIEVAEAFVSVVWPVALMVEVNRLLAVSPVVEALVMLAMVE